MMKKKYIIGIVIVAVIFITVGLFMQTKDNKKDNNNTPAAPNKQVFEGEVDGRHCLGSLCIDTVFIEYYDDNAGNLGFMLINTDETNVQIGGNFVITPDNSSPLTAYFNDIQPGDMQYVKVDFFDKNITEMKDYVLSDLVADGNEEV